MGLFDELDAVAGGNTGKGDIVRAPFGWPGGKSKSIKHILPYLPYGKSYIEPFGGSFAIGLARQPSKLEVYNDRYGGVVSFYRVIRDPKLFEQLVDRLDLTVHSREEFYWCKDSYNRLNDDVERAARWYYMIESSFATLGRNWGRSISSAGRMAGKIRDKLAAFPDLHRRLKYVQIDNQDWFDCIMDYDSSDAIFYVDPPYIDASSGIYKHELKEEDYHKLIQTIFNCKGFVALSGYAGNPIFDNNPWDNKYTWAAYVSIESTNQSEGNRKAHLDGISERGHAQECLWIKEAK